MPALNEPERRILGGWVWPYLTAAAEAGLSAATVQQGIAGIAEENNTRLTFEDYTAIATQYGYARRMFNASQEFQGANPGQTITPDMIGVPPWARDQQQMNTSPMFHATFEFTYIDQAGNEITDFRTSGFPMTLDDTVGDLLASMQSDAEAMAAKYEVSLVGINPIQILAV